MESLPLLVFDVLYVVNVFIGFAEQIVVVDEAIHYCGVLMLGSQVNIGGPGVILLVLGVWLTSGKWGVRCGCNSLGGHLLYVYFKFYLQLQ